MTLRALAVAVLLSACAYDPPGTCAAEVDCPYGLRCENAVCVGCQADSDCADWQTCDLPTRRRCILRPDRCNDDRPCSVWSRCDLVDHTCRPNEGSCDTTADCGYWQSCNEAKHRCELREGFCDSELHCARIMSTCGDDHHCTDRTMRGPSADVVMTGRLGPQRECRYEPYAPLLAPTHAVISRPCTYGIPTDERLLPNGEVIYSTKKEPYSVPVLWKFTADAWKYDERRMTWEAASGWTNDPVLAQCAQTSDILDFVVQAGSGTIAHRCNQTSNYLGSLALLEGTAAGIRAWTAGGRMLLADGTLRDGQGGSHPLTPTQAVARARFVRVKDEGFLAGPYEGALWAISAEGVVTRVGPYATVQGMKELAMDSEGGLHVSTDDATGDRRIVRLAPDGSGPVVVYDKASITDNANNRVTSELRLFTIYDGGRLLTPP